MSNVDDISEEGRRSVHVRLPFSLASALEALRHQRSMAGGKRISLRALIERILTDAVASEKAP